MRCMVVGLTPEQQEACRKAVVPVEIVRAQTVGEACASMSTLLPLLVVVNETMSEKDRADLTEFTTACGAELVVIGSAWLTNTFASHLLDAIRIAERRRHGKA